jgi:Mn2+/Fe2+ NRAMP family transporter
MSGRPTFDIIRERLGPRVGMLNLFGSMAVTLLTFIAEIGGIALALELATGVWELAWVPVTAALVWIVLWRARFSLIENVFGILGLTLIVFAVALWQLGPDWGGLWHDASTAAKPAAEGWPSYWYYAIALFGAAMTPYEVFFFSSGAVEDGWTPRDLNLNRANVFIGFPLGGLLSLAIMASTAAVLKPRGISADTLGHVALPVGLGLGKLAVAVLLVGMFAAIFSAAIETSMSAGYTVSQFFGWQWGKYVRPKQAALFHVMVIAAILLAVALAFTTLDPIKVTEYSIVLSAAALPLTYFPILVVANDPTYVGEKTNSRFLNALGFGYLVLLLVVSVATIPVMILSRGGA